MNEIFLSYLRVIGIAALLISITATVILLHIAFLVSHCRRGVLRLYFPFMKKWILRRGIIFSMLLSIVLILFAVLPATFLAWYRTYLIHQLSDERLLVRIHDYNSIPMDNGGLRDVLIIRHTTTNSVEISELLQAIRFSPTYPNGGCLCSGGSRKFEIVGLSRYGHEYPYATFTISHDQSVRFEHDWYGDWHLQKSSQKDLAAWQEKYLGTEFLSSRLIDEIPASQTDIIPESNMTYRLTMPEIHFAETLEPADLRESIVWRVSKEFVYRTRLRDQFEIEPSSVTNNHTLHRGRNSKDELYVFVSINDTYITSRYLIRTEESLAAEQKRNTDRQQQKENRQRGRRRRSK